ncbi:hypothetical protein PFISCL1PPCAC_1207, partial [Pristionchus fissidentatus]
VVHFLTVWALLYFLLGLAGVINKNMLFLLIQIIVLGIDIISKISICISLSVDIGTLNFDGIDDKQEKRMELPMTIIMGLSSCYDAVLCFFLVKARREIRQLYVENFAAQNELIRRSPARVSKSGSISDHSHNE